MILAVSIMWLLVVPLELFLFLKLLQWPVDFTLLILVPILLTWIIGSYPLVLASNERYLRGESLALSGNMTRDLALIAVCLSIVCGAAVFAYLLLKSSWYFLMILVGLSGLAGGWGLIKAFGRLVADIRRGA
jgi:hypothetical protein